MSIAVLNEVTGAGMRTLKKILKGATPVGVHANGNLYTLAQAKRLQHRQIHRHAQAVVEDRAPISPAITVGVLEHQHAPSCFHTQTRRRDYVRRLRE